MTNQPLSNRAWRALDVVCKQDREHRVEDQRRTIARLRREIEEKNQQMEEMRNGDGRWLYMPKIWEGMVRRHPDFKPPKHHLIAHGSLYDFLLALNFPPPYEG